MSEGYNEFTDTGLPITFNICSLAMAIPLCDDFWLGMQVQNIAVVDISIIREMELKAVRAYVQEERNPIDVLIPLSALSQMWVFALYEFLRTWRRRAEKILHTADQYARTKPDRKIKYMESVLSDAKGKERHVKIAPSFYAEHLSRVFDEAFVDSVRRYYAKTDGLFRDVEALRVTLAKHEVPKSNMMMAEAPGYARMDIFTGSLYWFFIGQNGALERVDRRELSNSFLGIELPDFDGYDADQGTTTSLD